MVHAPRVQDKALLRQRPPLRCRVLRGKGITTSSHARTRRRCASRSLDLRPESEHLGEKNEPVVIGINGQLPSMVKSEQIINHQPQLHIQHNIKQPSLPSKPNTNQIFKMAKLFALLTAATALVAGAQAACPANRRICGNALIDTFQCQ